MPTNDEKYEDLLGTIPTKKWQIGLWLVVLMIVLIAAFVWWLDYRSAVEVPLQIFGTNKSLEIKANHTGKIGALWLKNGAEVKQGDPLISYEAVAKKVDLDQLVTYLKRNKIERIPKGQYGELSSSVGELQSIMDQLEIIKTSGTEQQAIWMEQSRDSLTQIIPNIEKEIKLIKKELEIAEGNYKEYLSLYKAGAASKLEVNAAKISWLQYQQKLETKLQESKRIKAGLLSQKGAIIRLLTTKNEKIALLESSIQAQKQQILSEIQAWQTTYLLKAPQKGIVHFLPDIQKGSYLQAGDMVAKLLLPSDSAMYQANGFLPANRSGEVEIGDEVLLRLNAYPYRKFGQIEGRVAAIGEVFFSQNGVSGTPIIVSLENGLTSTQGRQLVYVDGMPALGRILVK